MVPVLVLVVILQGRSTALQNHTQNQNRNRRHGVFETTLVLSPRSLGTGLWVSLRLGGWVLLGGGWVGPLGFGLRALGWVVGFPGSLVGPPLFGSVWFCGSGFRFGSSVSWGFRPSSSVFRWVEIGFGFGGSLFRVPWCSVQRAAAVGDHESPPPPPTPQTTSLTSSASLPNPRPKNQGDRI